jgi:NTE family protein
MPKAESLTQPTLGLALSGSGSSLAFYIGFLEELRKAKLKIDYIAACSGGSIVAASFACDTLEVLKELLFRIKGKEDFEQFVSKAEKSGLYSLEKFERLVYNDLTKGFRFEDVKPLMGFVAVDLDNGKQVIMSMGDIAKAVRISCTLPGIFEPVKWGENTLIDGGLLNVIPVDVVKQAGIDVIIGLNMRGTDHIFTENQMTLRKILKLGKKALLLEQLEKFWEFLLPAEGIEAIKKPAPGMFSILGKSMDLAIKASKQDHSKFWDCDLMVSPDIKDFSLKEFHEASLELYDLGKKTAKNSLPEITRLLASKQKVAVSDKT